MARAADAKTLPLEAQAADTAAVTPSSPRRARTKSAMEKVFCVVAVVEPVGQRVGHAFAVGELRVTHTRGARADEHADAPRTEVRARRSDRLEEAVAAEREFRETVVAAVEGRQLARQSHGIESRHLADPAGELRILEVARRETGAFGTQRRDVRVAAAAGRAGHGVRGDRKRFHGAQKSKKLSQL